jgi:hypothetical protein
MSKKSEIFRDGGLVTVGSLTAMVAEYALYYMLFMLFMRIFPMDGSFHFVAPLRIGYGILWIPVCLILYRTKIPEWLKACFLAGALTALMTTVGVQLYQTPVASAAVLLVADALAVFLLIKAKKQWFHYYAIALATLAAVFYLQP